jgi:hypothetical protein
MCEYSVCNRFKYFHIELSSLFARLVAKSCHYASLKAYKNFTTDPVYMFNCQLTLFRSQQ